MELADEGVLEQLNLLEDKKLGEVMSHAKRVTNLATDSRTENYRRYGLHSSCSNCHQAIVEVHNVSQIRQSWSFGALRRIQSQRMERKLISSWQWFLRLDTQAFLASVSHFQCLVELMDTCKC